MPAIAARISAVTLAVAGVAALFALLAGGSLVRDARAQEAPTAQPPGISLPAAPDAPVFTDTYDAQFPNDLPGASTWLREFGDAPCAAPTPVAFNATFWRAGLSNPALDIDRYRIDIRAARTFTFTVAPLTASDLSFAVLAHDGTGNVLFAQSAGASATFSNTASACLRQTTTSRRSTVVPA